MPRPRSVALAIALLVGLGPGVGPVAGTVAGAGARVGSGARTAWPTDPIATADLRIRDPFVVADADSGWYYLVGTGPGFPMYRSTDLATWYGPVTVFTPPPGFWGTHRSWAPEIRRWHDRWYLFGSFATAANVRVEDGDVAGTAVLVADAVDGPYVPLTDGPVTPTDRFALDGTLFVDDGGAPWLVYSQEWLDPRIDFIGRMAAVPLADDLSATAGDPVRLFSATDGPWVLPLPLGRVVDGPWVERLADGSLAMLWSSTGPTGYTTGIARSPSGSITGPWVQQCLPLYDADGGHAMVFRGLDGVDRVVLHTPNAGTEHPLIAPIVERDGTLVIDDPSVPSPSDAPCHPAPPTTTTSVPAAGGGPAPATPVRGAGRYTG